MQRRLDTAARRFSFVEQVKCRFNGVDDSDVKRLSWSALVIGAALMATTATAVVAALRYAPSATSDFAAFWLAGRWVEDGRPDALYPASSFGDASAGAFKGFLNPPYVAVLFAPLGALSLGVAGALFAVLNAVALGATASMSAKFLRARDVPRHEVVALLLLGVSSVCVATTFVNGSTSLLVTLTIVGVVALDRHGDSWRTGVAAAALSLKPQYAILPMVYLLLRRRYRAVAATAGTTAAVVAASLPFTGFAPWREYGPFLNRYASTLDIWNLSERGELWLPRQMLNVRGLLVRVLGDGRVALINALSLVVLAIGAACVVMIARRAQRGSLDPNVGWAVVIALTVVTSQHSNVGDGALIFVALGLWMSASPAHQRPMVIGAALAMNLAVLFGNPSRVTPVLPWSALCALCIALVALARVVNQGRGTSGPLAVHRARPNAPRTDRMYRDLAGDSALQTVLVVLMAGAMTILPYVVFGPGPDVWQLGATLSILDLVATALAACTARGYARAVRARALHRIEWAGLAFLAATIATFAAHPSMRGIVLLGRIATGLVIAHFLATTTDRMRTLLVRAVGVAAIVQCVIALSQRVTRGPIGLGAFGETLQPFRPGYPVPTGTMRDAYPLAGFGLFAAALVATNAIQAKAAIRFTTAVLLSGGALAALSGSRAALLTVLVVGTALAASNVRRGCVAAIVLAIGFVAVAVPSRDLWLRRTHNVATNATGEATDDISNGRSALTEQALGLLQESPLVGVGPGNYSRALQRAPDLLEKSPAGGVLPVHDLPLLIAAEGGILTLAPMLAVTALAVRASIRSRRVALFAVLVPYALLDLVFWFYPEGLLMIAIAIGFMVSPRHDRIGDEGAGSDQPNRNAENQPGVLPSASR